MTRTLSIGVRGMSCGACAARIESRLNALPGVTASVNFSTERALVMVPPTMAAAPIVAEIEAAGFETREVTEQAPDAVAGLRRRLIVVALLAMPMCDTSIALSMDPRVRFPGWEWVLLALAAPVLTWGAWPITGAAVRAARHRLLTMDTLVTLGILASTGWSIASMVAIHGAERVRLLGGWSVVDHSGGGVYLDVGVGVTLFVLAGRYYEARARAGAGRALAGLAALRGGKVRLDDGEVVAASAIESGDRFRLRPGDVVPTDVTVSEGYGTIDRGMITGEVVPLEVAAGDPVGGGGILIGGSLVVEATGPAADSVLFRLADLVERAQSEKAGAQRLADRIAGIFVPVVVGASLVTALGWLLAGAPAVEVVNCGLSVLIVACPCALGLATPAALHVASGVAASRGIFFKGYRAFEGARSLDTVLLDKTGTLTEGALVVAETRDVSDDALRLAASVEVASEHPLGRALVDASAGALPPCTNFEVVPGMGVRGTVEGHAVSVERLPSTAATPWAAARMARGETVSRILVDGTPAGSVAFADTPRGAARDLLAALSTRGLRPILVTGDAEPTARALADDLGLTEIRAGVLPDGKVALVEAERAGGHVVGFLGDGINDAPALAAADLGFALTSGAAIAQGTADVLVGDLARVPTALDLAAATMRTIRTNLFWAFSYNSLMIPLAALGLLDPLIAALAMACSSAFVVGNSARLSRSARRRP